MNKGYAAFRKWEQSDSANFLDSDDESKYSVAEKVWKIAQEAKEAKTCEWTQDEIGWISYHQSECGHDIAPEDAPVGDYCPYCGGKIVEKENKG